MKCYTHNIILPDAIYKVSVLMQRLSYPTETVLSNKITRNRIDLSFKDSPRKPLGRRPIVILTLPSSTPNHLPGVLCPRKTMLPMELFFWRICSSDAGSHRAGVDGHDGKWP